MLTRASNNRLSKTEVMFALRRHTKRPRVSRTSTIDFRSFVRRTDGRLRLERIILRGRSRNGHSLCSASRCLHFGPANGIKTQRSHRWGNKSRVADLITQSVIRRRHQIRLCAPSVDSPAAVSLRERNTGADWATESTHRSFENRTNACCRLPRSMLE